MDADPTTTPTLADAVWSIDERFDAQAAAPVALKPAVAGPRTGRFVRFLVASTSCAVSEAFVTELDRMPKITTVPRAPSWLRGVANLRGDVLSVVDLRVFLGLDATSPHTGRMLVVRLLDEEISVGLLVDAVDQILTLNLDEVRPPASPLDGPLAPFLTGMCVAGERLIAVLDLERLLRSADIRQFDDVKEDSSCEAR
ncbi:MAG: chemotaxis protein CheW [Vicinamibacterales bacterium]